MAKQLEKVYLEKRSPCYWVVWGPRPQLRGALEKIPGVAKVYVYAHDAMGVSVDPRYDLRELWNEIVAVAYTAPAPTWTGTTKSDGPELSETNTPIQAKLGDDFLTMLLKLLNE